MPSVVALIPARCGSTRIKDKNIRPLGGKPLLAWSVEAALKSCVFAEVVVATDSTEYGRLARYYGANVHLRPPAPADESDITWLALMPHLRQYDAFALLRPTSPFRTAATIQRAWREFLENQPCDSLRAVERVRQHPGKMWVIRQGRLLPLLPFECAVSPWHSSATQTLPPIYAQNASLEIGWSRVPLAQGTIAGTNVVPFLTTGIEGTDVNLPEDFERAEMLIQKGVLVT